MQKIHKDFLKYSIIIYLSDSSSDLLNSKSSLIAFTIFLFFIQRSDRTGKPGKLREFCVRPIILIFFKY